MSNCKNCGNKGCSTCERVVITKQGERGPSGPPGIQGPRGLQGAQGNEGPQGVPGATWTQVFYTEQSLGAVTGGTIADPLVLTGITYTVPALEDGNYRLTFNSNVNLGDGASDVQYQVYVNASPVSFLRREVSSDIEVRATSLIVSNIGLVATDVIEVYGGSNNSTDNYLFDATCIIEKIS